MADDAHYQLIFDGQLAEGFQPNDVRLNIARRFKLSEPQVERLFQGGDVVLKRGLDAQAAARYQQVFLEAGALVRLRAAEPESVTGSRASAQAPVPKAASNNQPPAQHPPAPAQHPQATPKPSAPARAIPAIEPHATVPAQTESATTPLPPRVEASAATLQLMPTGTRITDELEPDPPPPDTSHLSLIGGDDMSLSDCAPPEPEPPKLDLTGLKLDRTDNGESDGTDPEQR